MRFKIYVFLAAIILGPSSYAVEQHDWQNYLSPSCSTTVTGAAKRILGERGFWAHVNVSMDSWSESMRLEGPEAYCNIDYAAPSQTTKRLQCLASYKEKWDWYRRCKLVVVSACKAAGGFCN
jgi:hypothetical protein